MMYGISSSDIFEIKLWWKKEKDLLLYGPDDFLDLYREVGVSFFSYFRAEETSLLLHLRFHIFIHRGLLCIIF
jgi:hypothetical protein